MIKSVVLVLTVVLVIGTTTLAAPVTQNTNAPNAISEVRADMTMLARQNRHNNVIALTTHRILKRTRFLKVHAAPSTSAEGLSTPGSDDVSLAPTYQAVAKDLVTDGVSNVFATRIKTYIRGEIK